MAVLEFCRRRTEMAAACAFVPYFHSGPQKARSRQFGVAFRPDEWKLRKRRYESVKIREPVWVPFWGWSRLPQRRAVKRVLCGATKFLDSGPGLPERAPY